MSRCKYCGEHAGFLTKYHTKCHEVKSSARQNLLSEIESAIVEGSDLGALKTKIISLSNQVLLIQTRLKICWRLDIAML